MKIYGVRGQIRGAGNETLARLAGAPRLSARSRQAGEGHI